MAFVAGAALPLTSRRPARATCTTMMAEGGEKKPLGKWLLEKINHNFDFEYGYESFHKKAMTQKDAEERKRDEELRKANKK